MNKSLLKSISSAKINLIPAEIINTNKNKNKHKHKNKNKNKNKNKHKHKYKITKQTNKLRNNNNQIIIKTIISRLQKQKITNRLQ